MAANFPPNRAVRTLRDYIAAVPDFPRKGVMFRDISPLLREKFPEALTQMMGLLSEEEWQRVDVIAGVEARGFIFASAMAVASGKGMAVIRKKGKLPGDLVSQSYTLEYGQDELEMQRGSGRVLIVDDVLATGGTFATAADVAHKAGYNVFGFAALINLSYLNDFVWHGIRARHVINYAS